MSSEQLSGVSASELCAAYVDAMCVTFKHDLDREALARDVMRIVHEIFDRRELTRVFIHRDDVTGPEAVFCCDCMGPASSSCDSWGHGTVTLGELIGGVQMTEQHSEVPDEVLDSIDRALTSAVTTSLTLGPKLSEPYPDDPRWSPDTRFLQPMGRRALDARTKLREARS